MPSKNTKKIYCAPAYYHVYNRGANKSPIFIDDQDRMKFLSLISRYLDPNDTQKRSDGKDYEKFDVEVTAYCLMNNHFHLLLYQPDTIDALRHFMHALTTAYTMYFNLKYKHSGHLFQSVFKASHILNENYLLHISRYIHMNPRSYIRYKWSSVRAYFGEPAPVWLHPERINDMTPGQYREFLESYEGRRAELEQLKSELADQ